MKKVRTVIIGMGRMGKMRYQLLKEHGGFDILAVCDTNTSLIEGYSEKGYTEWKGCIDECDPEAVFVCTYNAFIPDIVCYSLEKGKHVFAEKPPGKSLDDALKMKSVSEKNPKCVLKFGFNHRYHNSVIEAKALIDSGIIGELVCARGLYGKAGNRNFTKDWRNNKNLSGGGILIDQGIHMVDLLCYFIGDFTTVMSSVDQLVWKDMETEDSAIALLKNDRGQVATLHSSAIQWKHVFILDLICTDGSIMLKGLRTSTNSYGDEIMTYYKKDFEGKRGKVGRPLEHTLCFDEDRSWLFEHQEFYDAVVHGKPIVNGTSDDAVQVMNIIKKIYID